MEKLHKQRFTVLLFIFCLLIMSFGNNLVKDPSVGYLLNYELMSVSSSHFQASVLIDKVSVSFGCVVTLISGCVFMFGRWYMKDDYFYGRFVWVLLSFVISMNVLIFSGSLIMMMVGWDGLGVSSFILIVYYQSKESLSAGFLTLLVNRIGDVLIMSVMFYYVLIGSSLLLNYSYMEVSVMLFMFGLAALTKSAQYPFSAWLPAAMAAPTPVSALVHSSTLVTAGIYILIRALMTMELTSVVSSLLLFCGSVTSLIGGMCAIYENDLKKIVAFSTLSQLGVMVFSLGVGYQSLALLHLFTHAMFKAMLFLVAGCVLMLAYGVQDIRILGAVTKNNPILLVFLNMSSLCLMGFPFLSAFYSKHVIISIMWSSSLNLFSVAVMVVAVFLTSVYMVRLMKNLNWSVNMQVVASPNTMLLFYIPMSILFGGSLLLGWIFSLSDFYYTHSILLPESLEKAMNILLVVSILSGLLLYKSGGVYMLTKMFYMDPVWYNMNMVNNKVSFQFKEFESWVEPSNYLSGIKSFLYNMNKFQWWPLYSLSLHQQFLVIMLVMVMMWVYLK